MDRLLPSGMPPNMDSFGTKSKFTPEEDQKLKYLVEMSNHKLSWKEISMFMRTRTPRQCRERYQNYLSDNVNHQEWTGAEDQMLLNLYSQHGKKWNVIAKFLPGRTGNAIRNRWQWLLKKQNVPITDKSTPILRAKNLRVQMPYNGSQISAQQPSSGVKSFDDFFVNIVGSFFQPGKASGLFENEEETSMFVS